MKIPKLFFLILSAAFIISIAPPLSQADNDPSPININFQVEGPSSSIYNQNVTVPACVTPNNASSTVNSFCAFNASGLTADVTWLSFGGLINSINGISGDSSNFWLWFLNGEPAFVGMDSYMLQPNDKILWALGRQPLKVSLSTTSPKVNATSTVTVLGFNPNSFAFEPVAGAEIVETNLITDANGKADIVATSTNPVIVSVTANGYIPSEQFTITPKAESINVVIRNSSTTAFSGSVDLPNVDAPNILITPNNSTSTVEVSPKSVLGILKNLETTSSTFKITNLAYFSSFNSFLVNCVAIPADSTTPDCYNWTYAVNNSFPQIGIDQAMVKDGDTIYFFFGSPHKTTLSKTTAAVGESFTVTAQMYDLSTGTYVPLTGVTLGIGNFNPDFSFSETATSTVNNLGQTTFTINATGTMEVGIKEDFYFPTTQITITEAAPAPPSGGGGGGGSLPVTFNIPSALNFISLSQNQDGSFDSSLTTDWTAVAFASKDPGIAKTKLKTYLQNYNYQPSSITDYERHAMALQALGINPYSGTQTDYITPIVNAFDGTQIGDSSLETDDIFAIFPLTHAGYTGSDEIIKKEIAYIISKQKPNGSWNDSVDVTAAAVMAIGPYFQTPGYVAATGKAFGYLASTQNQDGGWGNADSTSWVVTMLTAVKEGDPSHFKNIVNSSGLSGMDYLAKVQGADGAVTSANKTWSTSYAVTAASGKSWLSVLSSFAKPSSNNQTGGSSGSVLGTSTLVTLPLTTSTSTPATTTPSTISTTTPTIIVEVITPTTTPKVLPLPKPKINKIKTAIKPKVVVVTSPPLPTTEPTPIINKIDDTQLPPPKPNWFVRALTSIGSFFYKLF